MLHQKTMEIRTFESDDGDSWEAFATEEIVAHGKRGAVLAFRPAAADADEGLRSTVTFNSAAAADLALRTMADKELRRRLAAARVAAGDTT